MASIEVSLSSTPRKKKNGSLGNVSLASSVRSAPKETALKELESLRNALRDKENLIQSLRGQLNVRGARTPPPPKTGSAGEGAREEPQAEQRRRAEERLAKLKAETDNKRLAIKNLKLALERLDITE